MRAWELKSFREVGWPNSECMGLWFESYWFKSTVVGSLCCVLEHGASQSTLESKWVQCFFSKVSGKP